MSCPPSRPGSTGRDPLGRPELVTQYNNAYSTRTSTLSAHSNQGNDPTGTRNRLMPVSIRSLNHWRGFMSLHVCDAVYPDVSGTFPCKATEYGSCACTLLLHIVVSSE